jgi:hypothetical protein
MQYENVTEFEICVVGLLVGVLGLRLRHVTWEKHQRLVGPNYN